MRPPPRPPLSWWGAPRSRYSKALRVPTTSACPAGRAAHLRQNAALPAGAPPAQLRAVRPVPGLLAPRWAAGPRGPGRRDDPQYRAVRRGTVRDWLAARPPPLGLPA